MKKKIEINWLYVGYAVIGLLLVSFIAIEIYILAVYSGKPADQIPGWVFWFWFQRK